MSNFFDMDGQPITLEEWGRRFEDYASRILLQNSLDERRTLVTMWLGFVDPVIPDARLFGTALLSSGGSPIELETYDGRQDAVEGHLKHLAKLEGR